MRKNKFVHIDVVLSLTVFLFVLSFSSREGDAGELAKINGHSVSDKDLYFSLNALNEGQQRNILKDKNSRYEILEGLIDQELIVQAGEKEKIDQTTEFKAAFEQFKERFKKQYMTDYFLNKNVNTQLTESAVKKYYEKNKYKYTTNQVHIQHILLEDETSARQMLKKVQAPQADFQALAEQFSRDPSAKNNRGDLQYINLNSPFVDEFKEAALLGPVGEIIGPLKTVYGYHLIKIVDKKIGKQIDFEEVELRVKNALQHSLRLSYLQKLRVPAHIQIDYQALNKLNP